jgi:maltose O-acetyltransferase
VNEIGENVRIKHRENLTLGDGVCINDDAWINAVGGVTIGDNVLIGPKTVIHSANHKFSDPETPISEQGHTLKPVVIEDDVWIGASSVILAGVTIGEGAVVGAGSVVTKDVEAYTVVAGNPTQVIGTRQ